jgi:hypothetical protein
MSTDGPGLGRSLLGYRPASVRQILADRETMFHLAHERAELAEARLQALRVELGSARAELTAQTEAADAMLTQAKAELGVAREALDERSRLLAVLDARVIESQAEHATARRGIDDRAGSRSEFAEQEIELQAIRTNLREQTE